MYTPQKKKCSRGKKHTESAGELVFGVNNPAVLLRKILGLFSMAKRQNSSMQICMLFPTPHFFSVHPRVYYEIRIKENGIYLFLTSKPSRSLCFFFECTVI